MTTARAVAALLAAALLLPASASAFPGKKGTIAVQGRASAQDQIVLRTPDGKPLGTIATTGTPSRPAYSAAGMRIAWAAGGHVWVAQADGSDQRVLTTGYKDADPAWSPLGDAIAFTTGPVGGRDIWSVGTDGNTLRRLTSNSADEITPTWSARGDLAFVRVTDAGNGDIWRINAKGGKRKLTKGAADDRDPAWSPDGRRIAFTRATPGHRDVYIANSLGHHARRVRSLPLPAAAPVFAPDGRSIAFVMKKSKRAKRPGVWVMRTNGRSLRQLVTPSVGAKAIDWAPQPGDPVVAAAGDIACDPANPLWNDGLGSSTSCHERATSDELLRMDLNSVFMLGDLQYEDGTLAKIMQAYDPTWGRLKAITHPTIGNHEYYEPTASAYWDYFNGVGAQTGPAGNRGEGWYSLDIGAWHVVVLNSNCDQVACGAGSPQESWLRGDLGAHPAACTLAIMHHPLLPPGQTDDGEEVTPPNQPLWQALYDGGVDLALVGHRHVYERIAPLNPAAQADPVRGIRILVTGTGGKNLIPPGTPQPGSETRQAQSFGVTRVTLHASSYDWQFVPDSPGGYTDSGSAACH